MNFNNIDEINIFNNGDGTYKLEMYMSANNNECATFTIPSAQLDTCLTADISGINSIDLKLTDTVNYLTSS